MSACKECRYIISTKDKTCPKCGGEVSEKFAGIIIISNPEKSEIAKLTGLDTVGKYAIRVK